MFCCNTRACAPVPAVIVRANASQSARRQAIFGRRLRGGLRACLRCCRGAPQCLRIPAALTVSRCKCPGKNSVAVGFNTHQKSHTEGLPMDGEQRRCKQVATAKCRASPWHRHVATLVAPAFRICSQFWFTSACIRRLKCSTSPAGQDTGAALPSTHDKSFKRGIWVAGSESARDGSRLARCKHKSIAETRAHISLKRQHQYKNSSQGKATPGCLTTIREAGAEGRVAAGAKCGTSCLRWTATATTAEDRTAPPEYETAGVAAGPWPQTKTALPPPAPPQPRPAQSQSWQTDGCRRWCWTRPREGSSCGTRR